MFGKDFKPRDQLAENCIFAAVLTVARRQIGCVRFCYVPPDSRTPRRYECQPDLVLESGQQTSLREATEAISAAERDAELASEQLRVKPEFNSTRYGTPTYCQLADACAEEIKTWCRRRIGDGRFPRSLSAPAGRQPTHPSG